MIMRNPIFDSYCKHLDARLNKISQEVSGENTMLQIRSRMKREAILVCGTSVEPEMLPVTSIMKDDSTNIDTKYAALLALQIENRLPAELGEFINITQRIIDKFNQKLADQKAMRFFRHVESHIVTKTNLGESKRVGLCSVLFNEIQNYVHLPPQPQVSTVEIKSISPAKRA